MGSLVVCVVLFVGLVCMAYGFGDAGVDMASVCLLRLSNGFCATLNHSFVLLVVLCLVALALWNPASLIVVSAFIVAFLVLVDGYSSAAVFGLLWVLLVLVVGSLAGFFDTGWCWLRELLELGEFRRGCESWIRGAGCEEGLYSR